MHATLSLLENTDFPRLERSKLEILQVNLGYRCNQQCLHCHVNAGPKRKENMEKETVDQIVQLMQKQQVSVLDLTGGAPEMNPHFKGLIEQARSLGVHVIDRCNLTILSEPGFEDIADFLAEHRVEVVASLPCYTQDNVDQQRGKGVFEQSIQGLKKLNALGYGQQKSGLSLNLVYNPLGAFLPPAQDGLEKNYKYHLVSEFGIVFNQLLTITNMPIKRFGSTLISKGEFATYMQLLRDSFAESNLTSVMCKNLLSIDWQGFVYDCDFNQQLGLPAKLGRKPRTHISDLMNAKLDGEEIVGFDELLAQVAEARPHGQPVHHALAGPEVEDVPGCERCRVTGEVRVDGLEFGQFGFTQRVRQKRVPVRSELGAEFEFQAASALRAPFRQKVFPENNQVLLLQVVDGQRGVDPTAQHSEFGAHFEFRALLRLERGRKKGGRRAE